MEEQNTLSKFVAVGVAGGAIGDRCGDTVHRLVHEPQEQIERVGAKVSVAAYARLGAIGHPAPIAVEQAAQRSIVDVYAANPGDRSEGPLVALLLEEKDVRVVAHEIPGGEHQARVVEHLGHLVRVGRPDANWFLGVNMLVGLGRRKNQVFVQVGFGANDHGFDMRVGPDLLKIVNRRGIQLCGPEFSAGGIVVPDVLARHIVRPLFEDADKLRRVNVGYTDEGHLNFLRPCGRRREHRHGEEPQDWTST